MLDRRRGFTLVELLVAVGVLGLLLSAILSLTSGTLRYTSRVALVNERLEQLNDGLGYVGLMARSSVITASAGEFTFPSVTSVPTPSGCDISDADAPCVAFVVPVVSRLAANDEDLSATDYLVLGYQLVREDEWATAPLGFRAQAGSYVLLEHRYSRCGPLGTVPCDIPVSVALDEVVTSMVLNGIDPAVIDDAFRLDLQNRQFTIALQLVGTGRLSDVVVPSDGPLSLTVISRR